MPFDRKAIRRLQKSMMGVIPADDAGSPQRITIAGLEVFCARSVFSRERRIAVVGEFGDAAFPIRVVENDFTDRGIDLAEQELATFEGTVYQIISQERDVTGTTVQLILGDRYA